MKDYNLQIIINTILKNSWIINLSKNINEVTKTTLSFSEKMAKVSAEFTAISTVAWTLKEKLWWIFWNTINEADKLNNAMVGLKSIVNWTWNDFKQAEKFLKDFTSDGLVWTQDAATSLKNLLASWFWMKEAWQIMERLKDSAAFWRQGSLELGEAIKWATEWIKNENSVLVDNAWVTKNLSVMWQEYAKSIWKSVKNLTDSEKRQATLNWILKETRFQVWDAKKLTEQYGWQKAKLIWTISTLSATIWQMLLPTLSQMMNFITPIIEWIIQWSQENPWLAKTIISLAAWFTGLLIVFTSISAILPLLWWAFTILTWPIWLVVWAITTFVLAYQNNFWWIADLTNYFLGKIWEFFNYLWEGFWNLANIIYEYFERIKWPFLEFTDIISPILQKFFEIFTNFFTNTFDNIILFLKWAWNIIQWIFQVAFWAISGIFEIFINLFTWNWEWLWIAVINLVKNLWEWIKSIFQWFFKVLEAIVFQALEILKWIFSLAWESIKVTWKVAWKVISETLKIIWESIKNIAIWIFEPIKFFITTTWEGIKVVSTTLWEGIKTFLSNIWNWIKSLASWIWEGLKSLISTWWNTISNLTSNSWNNIKNFLSNTWDSIKSVASWIFEWTKNVISNSWNTVKSFSSSIWSSTSSVLSWIWNWISWAATSIFNWMKNSITSIFSWITDFVKNAWDTIKWIWNSITWASNDIDNRVARAKSASTITNTTKHNSYKNKAYGWFVFAWQPYMVGEQWRELFIPENNGKIIPNNKLQWEVNINFWSVVISNWMDLDNFVDLIKKTIYQEQRKSNLWFY